MRSCGYLFYLNQLILQVWSSKNEKMKCVANIFVSEDKLQTYISKVDLLVKKSRTKEISILTENPSGFKKYANVTA